MDFQKVHEFTKEARACRSCKKCRGNSSIPGEVLCKSQEKAAELDSFIGGTSYKDEFSKHKNISITQPFEFGFDCEFRSDKQDRTKHIKEHNDIPAYETMNEEG